MSWNRIQLVFLRELRDQVRDRRTMFTILVLPLLLYPFLGMLMLQVAQFRSVHPVRIAWVGHENWPSDQSLIDDNETDDNSIVRWQRIDADEFGSNESEWIAKSKEWIAAGEADAVLITTKSIADLDDKDLRESFRIVMNQASDQSVIASDRLREKIDDWRSQIVRAKLEQANLDPNLFKRIDPKTIDIAPAETKRALLWSKLLPLVMLIWALTGAFYPAIDLCAGEKERGTLETLLSSPATRREIVWGKLLTVITFSIATALLNLFSMQFTSSFVIRQFARMGDFELANVMGPLSLSSFPWLIIVLIPISTMFSALALAVAALARSSKEGQYYLMPLLLGGLPLVLLPMIPGITLSPGSSAIPVTGAVLLSRSLIEGQYREALTHAPIVIAVTIFCCLLAVRWAVRQFENESVMFRENERFQWSLWLRRLWEDRSDSPTANEALLCGVIILVAIFFGRMSLSSSEISWASMARTTVAVQLGLILAPCLIMAIFLTASIRRALRIERVDLADLSLAVVLAVALHPIYVFFASAIQGEFQMGADTREIMSQAEAVIGGAPLWSVLLVFAIIPAICEELAFRGFIFGGLIQQNGILRAILVSSLLFGFSHTFLQQSITATGMGFVLGFIAWRTGGVLCGIAFHMTHNGLTMLVSRIASAEESPLPTAIAWLFAETPVGWAYSTTWLVIATFIAVGALGWFSWRRDPQAKSDSRKEVPFRPDFAESMTTSTNSPHL